MSKSTKSATKSAKSASKKVELKVGKAQLRILAALAKAKGGSLTVAEMAAKGDVPATHISGFVFKATKAKKAAGYVSLKELKMVKEDTVGDDGRGNKLPDVTRIERIAIITALGRAELAKSK